jgi:hypothetical protein
MLKKAGHIAIMLLLLFGTTGLTITRHYCGNHLIQTSIFSTPEKCCKGNCPGCRNENINVRITDQFESNPTQINFMAGFNTLLEQHSLPILTAFSSVSNLALNDVPGDHFIKPSRAKPISAGNNASLLQIFLL